MKFNILYFLLLLSISLTAQKVKLKSKAAVYTAIQLPAAPLNPQIKTYSGYINANSQDLWSVGMKKSELNYKYLKIHGYQKLEEGGDILIELNLGKFEVVKEELEETLKLLKTLKKVKDGEVPEDMKYNYKFSFSMPIKLVVKNGDKTIYSEAITSGIKEKMEFKSPTFETAEEAAKNKKKHLEEWLTKAKINFVNRSADKLYNKLNAKIGFMPTKQTLKFYHPNTKKASQYKPFEAEVQNAISTINTITANVPIESAIKQNINDLIKEWENSSSSLSKADKNQAKLKKAYLHNIMEAALAIENFERATWAANQLAAEGLDKRAAKKRIQFINQTKEQLQKTNLLSRHQNMEEKAATPNDAITPDKRIADTHEHLIQATEEEERAKILGLHEKAKAYDMEVKLRNGYVEKGILVIDYSKYQDIVFYNGGNYSFFKESVEEGIVRKKFNLQKIESFDFEDRHFEVLFSKKITINRVPVDVIEEREVADKMTIYTAVGMTAEDANSVSLTGNFLVKKKADGQVVDLNTLKFLNFKKSFPKLIADCPDLAEKVKNGVLKRNLKDLMTIAHEYSACK